MDMIVPQSEVFLLPFLKSKQAQTAGLIVKTRAPDEKPEGQEDDSSAAIHSCASALITALHARDTKGVADALKDAFDILGSMPEDSEHTEPHSYDAQNIKAGQAKD